nr:hypothetical protein Iba_chr02bCG2000 [Ipomoea batatas]
MSQRRDFTSEDVIREIKCVKIREAINLYRDWSCYVVALQESDLEICQIPNAWRKSSRQILAGSSPSNNQTLCRTSDHSPATWINSIPIPIIKNTMGIL